MEHCDLAATHIYCIVLTCMTTSTFNLYRDFVNLIMYRMRDKFYTVTACSGSINLHLLILSTYI